MRLLTLFILVMTLLGCEKPSPNTLKIGTMTGPETELVETAKAIVEKEHPVTIKIVEFSDYNLLNEALEDNSLDANVFQHLPYLEAASKAHDYHFVVLAKTFIYPTGIYSSKVQSLTELKEGAVIALPNDPSNEERALLLLEKAGLITLKNKHANRIQDIETNAFKLHFKELDAAQLPRILPDVDAAVINTNFAVLAGLSPIQDALFIEENDSPYANLIVTREGNPKEEQLTWFIEAMHSNAVKHKAKTLFGDSAIPAW